MKRKKAKEYNKKCTVETVNRERASHYDRECMTAGGEC